MTDWIEHNGGPQPVADDVWVEVYDIDDWTGEEAPSENAAPAFNWKHVVRYRILNQHLIDAARLEGIRLGLEAAWKEAGDGADRLAGEWNFNPDVYAIVSAIRALNPDTITQEAHND